MLLKKCFACCSLVLLGVAGASMPMKMAEAEAKIPVLSVYGEAEVEVAPDLVKVYGVMKKTSSFVEDETSLVDEFSMLQENLAEIGVEKEKIKSLYFYDSAMNFDGEIIYRASLDFFVTTEDMESLKDVIDLINNHDNTKVKSLSFEIKGDDAYKEALRLAMENAISKAESLFSTDGMEISEIKEECYYYCNSSYKDFVSTDDLMENIIVKAKVKVTMDYAETNGEEAPLQTQENKETEIDKETGELIEE